HPDQQEVAATIVLADRLSDLGDLGLDLFLGDEDVLDILVQLRHGCPPSTDIQRKRFVASPTLCRSLTRCPTTQTTSPPAATMGTRRRSSRGTFASERRSATVLVPA